MSNDDGSENSAGSRNSSASGGSVSSGSSMDIEEDEVNEKLSSIAINTSTIEQSIIDRINDGGRPNANADKKRALLLASAVSAIQNPTTKESARQQFFLSSVIPPAAMISSNASTGKIIECKLKDVVYVRSDGLTQMASLWKQKGFTGGASEEVFRSSNKTVAEDGSFNTVHTLTVYLADRQQEFTAEQMGWTEEGSKWADTYPYKSHTSTSINSVVRSGDNLVCFFIYELNSTKDGKKPGDISPMMKWTRGGGDQPNSIVRPVKDGGLGRLGIIGGKKEKNFSIEKYQGVWMWELEEPIGWIEQVTALAYEKMTDDECGTASKPSKRWIEVLKASKKYTEETEDRELTADEEIMKEALVQRWKNMEKGDLCDEIENIFNKFDNQILYNETVHTTSTKRLLDRLHKWLRDYPLSFLSLDVDEDSKVKSGDVNVE